MTLQRTRAQTHLPVETFTLQRRVQSPLTEWLCQGLTARLEAHGSRFEEHPEAPVRFVLNVIDAEKPRPYRRKSQATFVMSIAELDGQPDDVMRIGYPLLVRSLSNLMMLLIRGGDEVEAHFLTPEQGHYRVALRPEGAEAFFDELYARIHPLASSQLVVDNVFHHDLEPELWEGDELTRQMQMAGRRLDALDLLPAPFPINDLLSPRELRHVDRLFGIGGLSYGNLSARKDERRFWMSASGVNKGQLETIGRDMLMVTGYDAEEQAMTLSVPKEIEPRRVSVDAIEHWMVYGEHPEIGAIVHVHAWMDGVRSTEMNYPCGTLQMAEAVADLLRHEPDPSCAVIGMKNHGITITGPSLENIMERAADRIVPQVPMS